MTEFKFCDKLRRRQKKLENNVPWHLGNKIESKQFAANIGIPVPITYLVSKLETSIDLNILPNQFVVKPSEGYASYAVYCLKRKDDNLFYDIIRNKNIEFRDVIEANYKHSLTRYSGDRRQRNRLLIEELLISEDDQDKRIHDYRFYAFFGKIALIHQTDEREAKNIIYNNDWIVIDQDEHASPYIPKCKNEMFALAKMMSYNIHSPFMRLDFYATNRGPVFGECAVVPGTPISRYQRSRFFKKLDIMLNNYWLDAEQRLNKQKEDNCG